MYAAYNAALRRGLWARTYAATNPVEYFAVGTQAYFNQGKNGPVGGDGVHNHIDTREELKRYDPTLYAILKEVFPCGNMPIDRCDRNQDYTGPIRMNCDGKGVTPGPTINPPTINPPTINPPSTSSTTTQPPITCTDIGQHCPYWARTGECQKNALYMLENCKKSCNLCIGGSNCADKSPHCSYWARSGECTRNPLYMTPNCSKSCNKC